MESQANMMGNESLAHRFEAIEEEELRNVLESRRVRLAEAPTDEGLDEAEPVLTARIGSESYGFPFANVVEVIRLTTLTRLAGVPPHILGLTNLRGEVLPVVDIRVFFEVQRDELTDLPLAVVVFKGEGRLAVLIDEVESLLMLAREQLLPPISTHTGIREEYQLGVTEQRSVVLNLDRILSDPRLIVNQEG